MQIREAIASNGALGFFHGTKSVNIGAIERDGLRPGMHARPLPLQFMTRTWESLAPAVGIPPGDLSADLIGFHPALRGKNANGNEINLGNSIRMATGKFTYDGVAFASTKFAADGYARDGSESAAAALALLKFVELTHPHILTAVTRALNPARPLHDLFQEAIPDDEGGVILRLRALPNDGFFFYPGAKSDPVTDLPETYPGSGTFHFAELFFSGSIPMRCLEIVE